MVPCADKTQQRHMAPNNRWAGKCTFTTEQNGHLRKMQVGENKNCTEYYADTCCSSWKRISMNKTITLIDYGGLI